MTIETKHCNGHHLSLGGGRSEGREVLGGVGEVCVEWITAPPPPKEPLCSANTRENTELWTVCGKRNVLCFVCGCGKVLTFYLPDFTSTRILAGMSAKSLNSPCFLLLSFTYGFEADWRHKTLVSESFLWKWPSFQESPFKNSAKHTVTYMSDWHAVFIYFLFLTFVCVIQVLLSLSGKDIKRSKYGHPLNLYLVKAGSGFRL